MERYPVGETDFALVEVHRHERPDAGAIEWTVTVLVQEGGALLRLPGHYAGVLAPRLADAAAALAGPRPARRVYRDEFLDLTAVERPGGLALAVTSTARYPFRVSLLVPEEAVEPLAGLLEQAAELVDTLRLGIALVPDRLPDDLGTG